MKRSRALIFVHLPDGDIRDDAGNRDVDARVFQWEPVERGIAPLDEEIRRERLVGGRRIVLRHGCERGKQDTPDDSDSNAAS